MFKRMKAWQERQIEKSEARLEKLRGDQTVITAKRAEITSTNASYGLTFRLVGDTLTHHRHGKIETQPVAGAVARVEESGTVFRQNRLIIEGPEFYWETTFSPRTGMNPRGFMRKVNAASRRYAA